MMKQLQYNCNPGVCSKYLKKPCKFKVFWADPRKKQEKTGKNVTCSNNNTIPVFKKKRFCQESVVLGPPPSSPCHGISQSAVPRKESQNDALGVAFTGGRFGDGAVGARPSGGGGASSAAVSASVACSSTGHFWQRSVLFLKFRNFGYYGYCISLLFGNLFDIYESNTSPPWKHNIRE